MNKKIGMFCQPISFIPIQFIVNVPLSKYPHVLATNMSTLFPKTSLWYYIHLLLKYNNTPSYNTLNIKFSNKYFNLRMCEVLENQASSKKRGMHGWIYSIVIDLLQMIKDGSRLESSFDMLEECSFSF